MDSSKGSAGELVCVYEYGNGKYKFNGRDRKTSKEKGELGRFCMRGVDRYVRDRC